MIPYFIPQKYFCSNISHSILDIMGDRASKHIYVRKWVNTLMFKLFLKF